MQYVFKLYVTGHSPNCVRAISNLKRLLEGELKGQYTLKIVDLLKNPHLARSDRVLAAPTLEKTLPPPARRVIGDLSDRERVISALNLVPGPDAGSSPAPDALTDRTWRGQTSAAGRAESELASLRYVRKTLGPNQA